MRMTSWVVVLVLGAMVSSGRVIDSQSGDERPARPLTAALQMPSHAISNSHGYSFSALDLLSENLGPSYYGHDPEALFSTLSASSTKSEFESTAEYNQRLARITSGPTLGSLRYDSDYAFYVQESGTSSRYDADNRTLAVSIELRSILMERPVACSPRVVKAGLCYGTEKYIGAHSLVSKTSMQNLGEYTGTNSYGAAALVKSENRDEYEIAFSNMDDFPTKSGLMDKDISVTFPMDASSAQRVKGNLRVIAVCRLVAPYATSDLGTHQATLGEPYMLVTHFNYIHANILELWIYDISSGQVLAKVRATEKVAAPSPESIAKAEQQECDAHPRQTKCRVLATKIMEKTFRQVHADARVTSSENDDTTIIIEELAFEDGKTRDKFLKEAKANSDWQKNLCAFGFTRVVLKPSGWNLPTKGFNLACL